MIVIDTSVWIDHFRREHTQIVMLLISGDLHHHPLVTAELAMGNLHNWRRTVTLLGQLPQALYVSQAEMLDFVEDAGLAGSGIGMVDAHLLASTRAVGGRLWTQDRRLFEQADRLGVAYRI